MSLSTRPEASRHLPLQGCFNFRDVGGYRSSDGRTVAWRFLFRADGPRGLTPIDIDVLSTLKLAVLTDPSAYPALVHCSAGKDRTGVLVALVLGLVGVSDDDIVADYALSRIGMEQMLDSLDRAAPEVRERVERYRPAILSADPTAMALFLERVRVEYGSLDGWAADIGLPGVGRFLRERLLQ